MLNYETVASKAVEVLLKRYQSQMDPKISVCRSSPSEVFFKKGVLRNFTKFTRKHLCQSLFFNKVACLRHRDSKRDPDTGVLL